MEGTFPHWPPRPQPGDTPPTQAAPAQTPPDPEPAAPAVPPFSWAPELGVLVDGVPLVTRDVPHGGVGIGILVGLDLAAAHEHDQKRTITGTNPPEYEPIPKSGGAAWYYDAVADRTWTVALNPDQAEPAGEQA